MISKIPKPGSPVRGSQSGKPIMALFDLMGRRWALGIIWNLSNEPKTFRQLQTSCETLSPSVLNTRLKELRESNIVEHNKHGYSLTSTGQELFALLHPFGNWSINWANKLDDTKTRNEPMPKRK